MRIPVLLLLHLIFSKGKQYVATLYADGKEVWILKRITLPDKKGLVTNKNKMSVKLARSGGFAVSLIEATR